MLMKEAPDGAGVWLCYVISRSPSDRTEMVCSGVAIFKPSLHCLLYGLWPVPGMIKIAFDLGEHTAYYSYPDVCRY